MAIPVCPRESLSLAESGDGVPRLVRPGAAAGKYAAGPSSVIGNSKCMRFGRINAGGTAEGCPFVLLFRRKGFSFCPPPSPTGDDTPFFVRFHFYIHYA